MNQRHTITTMFTLSTMLLRSLQITTIKTNPLHHVAMIRTNDDNVNRFMQHVAAFRATDSNVDKPVAPCSGQITTM